MYPHRFPWHNAICDGAPNPNETRFEIVQSVSPGFARSKWDGWGLGGGVCSVVKRFRSVSHTLLYLSTQLFSISRRRSKYLPHRRQIMRYPIPDRLDLQRVYQLTFGPINDSIAAIRICYTCTQFKLNMESSTRELVANSDSNMMNNMKHVT